ncbi:hypothetical protein GOBAR_DD18769 [Gossypium barbadense]|nr:hypothetical protein GOBAR_DD18769 [Gossypium barbadense]
MKPKFLFLFLVLCSLTIDNVLATSLGTHGKIPDNETIYRVSKQRCWGCIGESLEFLFTHNLVRATKWEPLLFWDFQLEKYARWWALQRKADCKLQHSFPEGDFKLGENIYWGSGSAWRPGDAVSACRKSRDCGIAIIGSFEN